MLPERARQLLESALSNKSGQDWLAVFIASVTANRESSVDSHMSQVGTKTSPDGFTNYRVKVTRTAVMTQVADVHVTLPSDSDEDEVMEAVESEIWDDLPWKTINSVGENIEYGKPEVV